MREYKGGSRNCSLVSDDEGNLNASAEIALLVTEPVYEIDAGGQLIRRRAMESIRFAVTDRSLKALIKWLGEVSADLSALQTLGDALPDMNLQPATPSPAAAFGDEE